jgi:serine/threonine-protein kinase
MADPRPPALGRVPEPGEVVAGKYVVEGKLSAGGMGVVLKARHPALGQDVALKILRPDYAAVPVAVERFAREARAAAQIRGEHVVRIYDVGVLDGGTPYMVMELLEGSDLGAIVAARGTLSVVEVAEVVLQTCEALAQAHRLGIVHRDLKPQNVFITSRPDGTPLVKLVDFGISKLPRQEADHDVTTTASLLGTPTYMSPEQLLSPKDVDGRSDIWSLGVLMYRMLAGTAPFRAETLPELCAAILTKPLPPLTSRRADIPEDLERIVHRCLEREPASRFQGVAELARELSAFAPPRSQDALQQIEAISARSGPAAALSGPSLPGLPAAEARAETRGAGLAPTAPSSRGRVGLALLAVAAALALSTAGVVVLRGAHAPAPAALGVVVPPIAPPIQAGVSDPIEPGGAEVSAAATVTPVATVEVPRSSAVRRIGASRPARAAARVVSDAGGPSPDQFPTER